MWREIAPVTKKIADFGLRISDFSSEKSETRGRNQRSEIRRHPSSPYGLRRDKEDRRQVG
jgi:hypothetical protein